MAIEVTAPDGAHWRVRRPLLELRRPRYRGVDPSGLDLPDAGGLDDGLGIVAVVLAVIAAVLLVVFIAVVALPLLLFGVELVVVLVVAGVGLLGRVLLRRPWLVVATGPARARVERRVVGWRESGEAVGALAAELGSTTVVGAARAPRPPADPAAAAQRATGALILTVLWLGGLGSGAGLVLAVQTLRRGPRTPSVQVLAWLAIVLGVAGLLLSVLAVVGAVAQPDQIAQK